MWSFEEVLLDVHNRRLMIRPKILFGFHKKQQYFVCEQTYLYVCSLKTDKANTILELEEIAEHFQIAVKMQDWK